MTAGTRRYITLEEGAAGEHGERGKLYAPARQGRKARGRGTPGYKRTGRDILTVTGVF